MNRRRQLYLGEVEEDLDGEGDDLHAGSAPVAAAYQHEDDTGGVASHQPLAALWRQPGGGLCIKTVSITTQPTAVSKNNPVLVLPRFFRASRMEEKCLYRRRYSSAEEVLLQSLSSSRTSAEILRKRCLSFTSLGLSLSMRERCPLHRACRDTGWSRLSL